MKYLQLADIKRQLNVDSGIDDKVLTNIGDAVENATENHIGQPISNTLVDGQVPKALMQAMLMLCGTLYDNRESVSYTTVNTHPAYEALIGPYRRYC